VKILSGCRSIKSSCCPGSSLEQRSDCFPRMGDVHIYCRERLHSSTTQAPDLHLHLHAEAYLATAPLIAFPTEGHAANPRPIQETSKTQHSTQQHCLAALHLTSNYRYSIRETHTNWMLLAEEFGNLCHRQPCLVDQWQNNCSETCPDIGTFTATFLCGAGSPPMIHTTGSMAFAKVYFYSK
jgi:hypothetical protein